MEPFVFKLPKYSVDPLTPPITKKVSSSKKKPSLKPQNALKLFNPQNYLSTIETEFVREFLTEIWTLEDVEPGEPSRVVAKRYSALFENETQNIALVLKQILSFRLHWVDALHKNQPRTEQEEVECVLAMKRQCLFMMHTLMALQDFIFIPPEIEALRSQFFEALMGDSELTVYWLGIGFYAEHFSPASLEFLVDCISERETDLCDMLANWLIRANLSDSEQKRIIPLFSGHIRTFQYRAALHFAQGKEQAATSVLAEMDESVNAYKSLFSVLEKKQVQNAISDYEALVREAQHLKSTLLQANELNPSRQALTAILLESQDFSRSILNFSIETLPSDEILDAHFKALNQVKDIDAKTLSLIKQSINLLQSMAMLNYNQKIAWVDYCTALSFKLKSLVQTPMQKNSLIAVAIGAQLDRYLLVLEERKGHIQASCELAESRLVDLEKTKKELAQKTKQRAVFDGLKNEWDAKKAQFEKTIQALQAKETESKTSIDALNKRLHQQALALQKRETLKQSLNKSNNKIKHLEAELQNLKVEREREQLENTKELKKLQSEKQALAREIVALKQEKESNQLALNKKLEATLEVVSAAELKLKQLEHDLGVLEQANASLKAEQAQRSLISAVDLSRVTTALKDEMQKCLPEMLTQLLQAQNQASQAEQLTLERTGPELFFMRNLASILERSSPTFIMELLKLSVVTKGTFNQQDIQVIIEAMPKYFSQNVLFYLSLLEVVTAHCDPVYAFEHLNQQGLTYYFVPPLLWPPMENDFGRDWLHFIKIDLLKNNSLPLDTRSMHFLSLLLVAPYDLLRSKKPEEKPENLIAELAHQVVSHFSSLSAQERSFFQTKVAEYLAYSVTNFGVHRQALYSTYSVRAPILFYQPTLPVPPLVPAQNPLTTPCPLATNKARSWITAP